MNNLNPDYRMTSWKIRRLIPEKHEFMSILDSNEKTINITGMTGKEDAGEDFRS